MQRSAHAAEVRIHQPSHLEELSNSSSMRMRGEVLSGSSGECEQLECGVQDPEPVPEKQKRTTTPGINEELEWSCSHGHPDCNGGGSTWDVQGGTIAAHCGGEMG